MLLGRPSVRVCVLLVAVDHKNRACVLLVQSQNVVVLQYSPINMYCGMVPLWLMLSQVQSQQQNVLERAGKLQEAPAVNPCRPTI